MSHWLDKHIAEQHAALGEWAINLIADAALAEEHFSADELEEFADKRRRSQSAEAES